MAHRLPKESGLDQYGARTQVFDSDLAVPISGTIRCGRRRLNCNRYDYEKCSLMAVSASIRCTRATSTPLALAKTAIANRPIESRGKIDVVTE